MLVVRDQFHLNGEMVEIGQELTGNDEKQVRDNPELLKRCIQRAEVPSVQPARPIISSSNE